MAAGGEQQNEGYGWQFQSASARRSQYNDLTRQESMINESCDSNLKLRAEFDQAERFTAASISRRRIAFSRDS